MEVFWFRLAVEILLLIVAVYNPFELILEL